MMKRGASVVIAAAFALSAVYSGPAFAGPYSDELGRCLVRSTTDADKMSLVTWIFAAAALHPAVKSIASVSDVQRAELNKKTAKLFERLLTDSCRSATEEALKYEGAGTLEAGFQILGQVAGRGLFSDPGVVSGMADFGKYFDREKIQKLLGPKQ